jgi:hypothetical protein
MPTTELDVTRELFLGSAELRISLPRKLAIGG